LAVLAATAAHARADCGPADAARPRVGLVLSGGGARGLAHIGVLAVLEEAGIRIDCVAGTSMGSALGALWASGYPSARIAEVVRSIDWQEVFSGRRERALVPLSRRIDEMPYTLSLGLRGANVRLPPSRSSDYRLNRLLFRLLAAPGLRAAGDFDRLPVPFRTVATDLGSGEPVVLRRGSLARAVRASMSTPVTLPTVSLDGRVLVDGGIVDNIPVDLARAMGADVVIAVDTSSPPLEPEQYRDVLGVGLQLVDVLMRARAAAFAQQADVLIRPDLDGHGFDDYSDPEALIQIGRRAALRALPALREKAPGRAVARSAPADPASPTVVEVEVRGNRRVSARTVEGSFGLRPPVPLRIDALVRGFDRVWATGLFETAWLDLESAPSGMKAVLDVSEKPRLSAEAGVAYDEADQPSAFVRLRNGNVLGHGERLEVALIGGEREAGARVSWLGDALWRRPIGYLLGGEIVDERPVVYDDATALGRPAFSRRLAWGGVQVSFRADAVARAYLTLGRVSSAPRPGLSLETGRDQHRMLGGLMAYDRLDDRDLPTAGAALAVRAERSLSGLGASRDYWRVKADGRAAWKPGGAFVIEALGAAGWSGRDVPDYELFRLGGPAFLPGHPREELWGRQLLAATLSPGYDWRGFRFALRAGAGNVWDRAGDLSLADLRWGGGAGVTRRTRFGPIALEGGVDNDGHGALYLSAGYSPTRR
jgi:NTE family protein